MKKSSMGQTLNNVLLPLLFGLLIVALWELKVLHTLLGVKQLQLPLPSRIISVLLENTAKIVPDAFITLRTAVAGMLIGSCIGFSVALAATVFPRWGYGGLTVLSAFNAIPVVALSPIMNVWFSSPDVSKTAVVSIVCMVAMSVNAYRGLNDVKPYSLDLMKSYASSQSAIFLKLRLPNCVPYIFTGLRINVAASMIGAIVSEYFSPASNGLGFGIRNRLSTGQFPLGWAYILAASFIGIILYMTVTFLEARAVRNRA